MKKFWRVLKYLGLSILGIIVLLLVVGFLFVNLSPQFGGKIDEQMKAVYSKSVNFKGDVFVNADIINMDMSLSGMLEMMKEFNKKGKAPYPVKPIEVLEIEASDLEKSDGEMKAFWFGHSALLIETGGKKILIDPMLGEVPAPHPWLGEKRFQEELPISIEDLPEIDALIISHDHYDHLDYPSIIKLKDKVKKFYCPLGVSAHLRAWGIEDHRIVELNWWEESKLDSISFICTPSQHFSGRGLTDRNHTLWASWVIKSDQGNIYFSGDGGYGDHFKEIGSKYGPFEFAFVECGQYNRLWSDIHMFPEESVQAAVDLHAKKMMPVHWGAFRLAPHDWTDPVERATKKAEELNIQIVTPQIGEPILLKDTIVTNTTWWR